jgi:hypothetical protein
MQPLPPFNKTGGGSELGFVNLSPTKGPVARASRRELSGAANSEKARPLRSSSRCDSMTAGPGEQLA